MGFIYQSMMMSYTPLHHHVTVRFFTATPTMVARSVKLRYVEINVNHYCLI